MIYNSLAKSSALNTNSTSQVHDIFQINFSGAQKIIQPSPVCVSCVRFSSTAAALNPSVVASCQTCTSCSGSTCSACLSHCKGCYSAVCGNCSIDVESVSGNIAEMFIVCLGCRDRYDADSSGSTMETGWSVVFLNKNKQTVSNIIGIIFAKDITTLNKLCTRI